MSRNEIRNAIIQFKGITAVVPVEMCIDSRNGNPYDVIHELYNPVTKTFVSIKRHRFSNLNKKAIVYKEYRSC